jgi:Flp pilus assembly protein TadD
MMITRGKIRLLRTGLVVLLLASASMPVSYARDLKISIPKRSKLTAVQRLNREGVEAVKRHEYDKARALFYKAYLFDPGDPFTLNNLGYVAELEGDAERAQNLYALASAAPTDAMIDRASSSKLEGQPLEAAFGAVHDVATQVNRSNVDAVRLIAEGRIREADSLLHQTLALDPKNPFTLNNVGVVEESQGEYSEALRDYTAAAASQVKDSVVVTMSSSWRGKPVSEMARESAARLRSRMKSRQSEEAEVALLNVRGVSALNRNDFQEASESFSRAYRLGPHNAFSLNNQGYVAEMNGDLESATEFYKEAQTAGAASARVGLATRPAAEGKKVLSVAEESEDEASNALEARSEAKHRNQGPIELKRRDGTPVIDSPPPEAKPNPPQQ